MDILEVELDALLTSFGSKVLVPSFVHVKRSDFCARLFVEISCFLITCRHSWIHIHYAQLRLRVLLPSPRGLLFDMLPVRATRKLWALEMAAIGGDGCAIKAFRRINQYNNFSSKSSPQTWLWKQPGGQEGSQVSKQICLPPAVAVCCSQYMPRSQLHDCAFSRHHIHIHEGTHPRMAIRWLVCTGTWQTLEPHKRRQGSGRMRAKSFACNIIIESGWKANPKENGNNFL